SRVIFFLIPTDWLLCPNMKKMTLESIRNALETMQPVVRIESDIADRARLALTRMLQVVGGS
ncbi:MAG TPA: quinolinate synthase NadA, partial [bacterium]|nr:quinolinate synthase NadA [bacterium]